MFWEFGEWLPALASEKRGKNGVRAFDPNTLQVHPAIGNGTFKHRERLVIVVLVCGCLHVHRRLASSQYHCCSACDFFMQRK